MDLRKEGRTTIIENLLLDRDGVINRLIQHKSEKISPQSIHDFEFIEGSEEAIEYAEKKDLSIYVFSNQPDVNKDWRPLTEEKLEEIDRYLKQLGIKAVFNCIHGPEGDKENKKYRDEDGNIVTCDCRKPQPGLVEEWYSQEDLKIGNTVVVGDSRTDMVAAERFEKDAGRDFHSKIKIGEDAGLCDKSFGSLKEFMEEELK